MYGGLLAAFMLRRPEAPTIQQMDRDSPPVDRARAPYSRGQLESIDSVSEARGSTTSVETGLVHRTVERPNGPDRFTVFPKGMTGVPKMSTWMSVDTTCVVDLETVR